jgi:hypothetical protein
MDGGISYVATHSLDELSLGWHRMIDHLGQSVTPTAYFFNLSEEQESFNRQLQHSLYKGTH